MTVLPCPRRPYIIWLLSSPLTLLSMNFLPALSTPAPDDFCVDDLTGQAHSWCPTCCFLWRNVLPSCLSLSIHSGLCSNFTSSEPPLVILSKIAPCYSLSSYVIYMSIAFIATWHHTFIICLLPVSSNSILNSMILFVFFTAAFSVLRAVLDTW